ncbi:MAG: hypothetical protein ACTHMG_02470 [Sphingomonas sp.]
MRTPYDAVLRALEREMDALKSTIADVARERDAIDMLHAELGIRIVDEAKLGMGANRFAAAYLARAREEHRRLAAERDAADARLTQLREHAASQYATQQAIERAAVAHREEQQREIDRAEQGATDDVVAARHVRQAQARRAAA